MIQLFLVLGFSFSFQLMSVEDTIEMHNLTPDEAAAKEKHNAALEALRSGYLNRTQVKRPFAEFEKVKYVLVSEINGDESLTIKKLIARRIPREIDFVVYSYTASSSSIAAIRRTYEPLLKDASQLKIIHTPGKRGFWARDALPVPVYMKNGNIGLVDARYFKGFEADQYFSDFFGFDLLKHNYGFEGGNFLADHEGRCFTRSRLPEPILKNYYGCSEVSRPKYTGGIGHIDERIKFVSHDIAITDSKVAQETYKANGFKVLTLPRLSSWRTYVNSLQVNNLIFVPIFGKSTDKIAKEIYEQAGLTVYIARSENLSDKKMGSIHCFTMAYPEVGFSNLLTALGAEEL